ncbi:MAG: hypothetical protein ACU84Q_06915 [Gammaproteobacteria bacterium]
MFLKEVASPLLNVGTALKEAAILPFNAFIAQVMASCALVSQESKKSTNIRSISSIPTWRMKEVWRQNKVPGLKHAKSAFGKTGQCLFKVFVINAVEIPLHDKIDILDIRQCLVTY